MTTRTFSALKKQHRALESQTYDPEAHADNRAYWEAREEFIRQLRFALDDRAFMLKTTKRQLCELASWCSSYRPREPHVLIAIIGRAVAG
jgi:hypothetical protein